MKIIKKEFIFGFFLLMYITNSTQCCNLLNFDIWTNIVQTMSCENDPLKTICIIKNLNKGFYRFINSFLSITVKELQAMINTYPISKAMIQNHYFIKWLKAVDACIKFDSFYSSQALQQNPKFIFKDNNSKQNLLKLTDYIYHLSKELGIEHMKFASLCACNQYLKYHQIIDIRVNQIRPSIPLLKTMTDN
jgi:hypothetical protein